MEKLIFEIKEIYPDGEDSKTPQIEDLENKNNEASEMIKDLEEKLKKQQSSNVKYEETIARTNTMSLRLTERLYKIVNISMVWK